ncbi:MAG: cyclic nucleotide-binding domain-containing protein [Deltaproteobacteria bacterium]|nr:cyclic nucleotide-binding domain-containing protein [Deltaproteobacteria bacterium]
MARDLRRLKDEAATAVEKHRWDDAARLFAELSAAEPDDGRWALRVGEIQKRRGRHAEALGWLDRAARTFLRKGFLVKAVAVARMITAMDPNNDALLREIEEAGGPPPPGERPRSMTPSTFKMPGEPTTGKVPALPPLPGLTPAPVRTDPSAAPTEATSLAQTRVQVPPGSALATAARNRVAPLTRTSSGEFAVVVPGQPPSDEVEVVFDDAPDNIALEVTELDFEPVARRSHAGLDAPTSDPDQVDARTLERLPAFPLFSGLSRADFGALTRKLLPLDVDARELVVCEGDPADSMYVVVEGRVRVERKTKHGVEFVAHLAEGDVFGEMATLLDAPRQASVVAETDLKLLALSASDVRRLAHERPSIGERIMRLVKRRALVNVLGSAELFTPFEPSIRLEIARLFEVRDADRGTELIVQGKRSDGLFVLLTGAAVVERDGSQRAHVMSGAVVGEHSMLTGGDASATVRMESAGLVLRLSRARFQELIMRYPPVLEHLSLLQSDRGSDDVFSITLV